MADLLAAVDALDLLIARARSVASPTLLADAAGVARRVRRRRALLGDSIVIALAGGTGSGKSSLLNAIAGEEVAETGAQRPVTSRPLAWIPVNPEPGLTRLLDALGIEQRVGHDRSEPLAVIDLPDTDSIETEHRLVVGRLIPEVDAVIWVLDPEKYHDRVLHEDHIAPMSVHADRTLFVLNQIDRLDQIETVVADLRAGLIRHGYPSPTIVTTAADPAWGPVQGIEQLLDAVRVLGEGRRLVERKLVADCRAVAQRLATELGPLAEGTGFSRVWEEVSAKAAYTIVDRSFAAAALAAHGTAAGKARVALIGGGVPEPPRLDLGLTGTVEAAAVIRDGLGRVGRKAGGEVNRLLRAIDVEGMVARSAVTVDPRVGAVTLPGWLTALAWLRRLCWLGMVVAGFWLVESERRLTPVMLMAALAVIQTVAVTLGGVMGRREGVAVVAADRARVAKAVETQLDRTIGREARDILRQRAEVGAAVTELSLVMAHLGEGTAPTTGG